MSSSRLSVAAVIQLVENIHLQNLPCTDQVFWLLGKVTSKLLQQINKKINEIKILTISVYCWIHFGTKTRQTVARGLNTERNQISDTRMLMFFWLNWIIWIKYLLNCWIVYILVHTNTFDAAYWSYFKPHSGLRNIEKFSGFSFKRQKKQTFLF